ncbi:hypothetical protein Acr_24g0015120 [Actinidia rufa]|uniref:Transmembrane protein n=1 Tax=Actinidia rufa TaxID=165716 RepID=A0A7J0GX09_9ERIC|nr:hypothetical protein Acr_24g0015120 [Actinidia rufa]
MGGGGDHGHHGDAAHGGDFRAKVWSMTGGPYCRPKHWKRNTAIAMVGVVLICIPVAMKSAELELGGGGWLRVYGSRKKAKRGSGKDRRGWGGDRAIRSGVEYGEE